MNFKQSFIETFKLAVPVMIGQVGVMMMNVVDNLMVGRLGAVPLAAASLAHSYFILIFIILNGVAMIVTPLTAIAKGENNLEKAKTYLTASIVVNFCLTIILYLILMFTAPFLNYLNQPPEVVSKAIVYNNLLGLSLFPTAIFFAYKQYIEGFSFTKPAMYLAIIANFINVFINYFVIYGNYGAPKLGLNGAAVGTFSARLFMAVGIIVYIKKSKEINKLITKFSLRNIDFSAAKKILALGLPGGLQYFFEVGAFSFAIIMVGWIGAKEMAAHQIALNLASIPFMAVTGISAAGSITVGNALGRKNRKDVRLAGFTALYSSMFITLFSGIIFVTMNNFLPTLYIAEVDVIQMTASILLIAAAFQLFDGVQAVGIGVLRGLTDVKGPTLITFVSYWIVALPLGYLFAFTLNYGISGVWIGLLLGLVTAATFLTLRFNSKSKRV